ncbi:MAG: hypothetical protein HKN27_08130 [Silicimonas sp.]|nr:hypothetical protein [Silicimonas sp.]
MKDNGADDTVIDRLLWAIESKALPPAASDYANHLLNRLSQPVRVSVFGLPQSGKSELINMFLGERLVPKDASLPTTEFAWADVGAMTSTSADGEITHYDHVDLTAIADTNAAFLRVELPAPILKRVHLLEVVTEGSDSELESATDWAVRRTDIALWCSQNFDQAEQSVWSRVPDSLKDHAFLVLTKADVLSAQKALSTRVASLESIVAEEFHSLFAVATLQAIRAQAGHDVDEAMFHASGGGALSSEVLRHAERGRRADFDSAHMFLARYQIKDAPAAKPVAKPQVVKDTPQLDKVTTRPVHVPAAVRVENEKLYAESIRFLKRRGDGLSQTASELGDGNCNSIVGQCVNAVEHLVDTFSQDESGCEATDAFIDDLSEAADMMILMQAEAGDTPAADAVTLLLQLRREMEMQLAA